MVIHIFPIAKLFLLLVKQISSPIARAVKRQAQSSPFFRRYICLPPARFYNYCDVKVKMWLLDSGEPVSMAVPNEAAAIDLGANLLGEIVVFTFAAGCLLSELSKSMAKDEAKEKQRREEIQRLQNEIMDLNARNRSQQDHIGELRRKLNEIEVKGLDASKPKQGSPPKEPPQIVSNPDYDMMLDEDEVVDLNLFKRLTNRFLRRLTFTDAEINCCAHLS